MSEEIVSYEFDGEIAHIGLNRLAKRNALSWELLSQITQACLRANEEAKVGLIFSHGDHFCAGLDLAEAASMFASSDELWRRQASGPSGGAFGNIARGAIPFIVAVAGACVGGGLELASACHIRVGDETAFFALPEGQRGIYPGAGASVRTARLLGVGRMTDLMLTGRVLSAAEAERFGLLNYVVPKGMHRERALSIAKRIAENAPRTNWAIVHGLSRIQDLSYEDGLFVEGILAQTVTSPESVERIREFNEKRAKPLAKPGASGDGVSTELPDQVVT